MNDDTVVELPRKRIKVDLEGDQKKDTLPANEVAKLCYEAYLQLGKSGKPDQRVEHTVLACVVESAPKTSARVPVSRVVALATGTKCFPQNLSRRQECIVDCHAESLLKRAFKCYLIDLFEEGLIRGRSIDQIQTEVLNCRNYCLFISQTPCGCVSRWKGVLEETTSQLDLKSFKVIGINRKPGRGGHCPKAGCIHKVAKWTIFGLQGRRLFGLTQRAITFNRIVLGNCESSEGQFESEEMNARLRVDEDELKCVQEQLRHTELFNFDLTRRPCIEFANEFRVAEFLREDEGRAKRPCGSSIAAWLKGMAVESN